MLSLLLLDDLLKGEINVCRRSWHGVLKMCQYQHNLQSERQARKETFKVGMLWACNQSHLYQQSCRQRGAGAEGIDFRRRTNDKRGALPGQSLPWSPARGIYNTQICSNLHSAKLYRLSTTTAAGCGHFALEREMSVQWRAWAAAAINLFLHWLSTAGESIYRHSFADKGSHQKFTTKMSGHLSSDY